MKRSTMSAAGLLTTAVWLALSGLPGQAQTPQAGAGPARWTQPRTPWGDPDLQGTWTNDVTSTPMERPKELAGREFLTEAEIAEKAKRDAVLAKGASDEELDGAVRPADVAYALPFAKGIQGQEYNRFWTDQGARKQPPTWKRTSLVIDPPDGRLPPFSRAQLQRWEHRMDARKHRGQADSWVDRYLNERCISGAQDRFGAAKRILQIPGYVFIVFNSLNTLETITVPLDGRSRLPSNMRQWQGDARGRWEGNTLVVETTTFIDRQDGGPIMAVHSGLREHAHAYPGSGETLRIVERFTRVGDDRMEYSYTLDDPGTFVRPYTVLRPMSKEGPDYQLLESACHEGNYGLPNSLTAARADEQYAMQAQADEDAARRKELQNEVNRLKEWEAAQGRR